MNNHTTPANRQASIFLSRKKRMETVRQALELLAEKLLAPEVSQNIIEMLQTSQPGDHRALEMSISIHRDDATPDKFSVKLRTAIRTQLGGENYLGLS